MNRILKAVAVSGLALSTQGLHKRFGSLVVASEINLAIPHGVRYALAAMLVYIWFRFEWQFGVGALFSLFHDVTITLGFFSLTQMEFDLNVVAALLSGASTR